MSDTTEYRLLKYEDNYADEFDIVGFQVLTKSAWDKFKKTVKKAKFPQVVYFGTNEYVDFDSSQDYLSRIEVKKITAQEAEFLQKTFGDSYGVFLEPDLDFDLDDDFE